MVGLLTIAGAAVISGGEGVAEGVSTAVTIICNGNSNGKCIRTATMQAGTTGAMAGVVSTKSAVGAAGGFMGGSCTAAGVSLATTSVASGPIGLLVVGADEKEQHTITLDCWKRVIHDISIEPSSGMLLGDLINHQNVSRVITTTGSQPELPHIVIENIWEEQFEIEYYVINETNKVVCHAKAI